MRKYLLIFAAILIIVVAVLGSIVIKQHKEVQRLQRNQSALLDTCQRYKTRSEASAASVAVLDLNKRELEKKCSNLTQEVKDLGIKLKRVQAVAQAASETKVEIRTVVKDSIIYRDREPDTLKRLEWCDAWVKFFGEIYNDSTLVAHIESRDTLTQVVHKVPHKFWFFRWGVKEIRQEIKTSNPHSTIVYSEYINVVK